MPAVRELVEQQEYFVLHAPRQVGKTTALLALAKALTAEGRYAALLVSMETGAAFPDDVGASELAVLGEWRRSARHQLPEALQPPPWPEAAPGARVGAALEAWAQHCPRPLVIFLDEVDALRDQSLVSVLRQLRAGHKFRPGGFPWSLGLVGLRDVRDYKVASGGSDHLHTASPFNIKAESLTMRDFTEAEVGELYAQHTAETGQPFAPDAVARAFELTQGQPWLVNALARQLVQVVVTDRARIISRADVDRARDLLIARQDTHLDSLAERLRDPRVRAVIEPMLVGDVVPPLPPDDLRFVKDLGLVRETPEGSVEMANPIYREIVARDLASVLRTALPPLAPTWLRADGALDPDALLDAFLAFWRQHGEALLASSPYSEAAPHLVLLAFLHRVVNGGGRIDREYAAGSKRLDLRVEYRGSAFGVEVKTWKDADKVKDPVPAGVRQLEGYLTRIGADRGWLVLFDQRKGLAELAERAAVERLTSDGRAITVVRL